jgi:hypothetical protein
MVDNDRPPKRRKRLKKTPDDARGFGKKFENYKFPFPKTQEKTSFKPTRSNGARSQPKMGTAQRNLTYSSVSDLYSELEKDDDYSDFDDELMDVDIDFENEEDLRKILKKSTKSNNNNKTNNKSNNNNNKNKNKNNKNNKNNTGLQRPPVWSAEDFVRRGAKKTDDAEDLDEILKRSTVDRDEDAKEAEEDDRARLKRASELLESKVKKEPIWYGDVDSDSDSERREGLAEKPIVISDSDSDTCEYLPPGTFRV